jgi:nucleoside-diphosphate-sugar epimerase
MVLAANDPDRLLTVAIRPHLIWGPHDNHLIPRLIDRARLGRLIRVGDGGNRVDLTYVDNAAKAHLLAADRLETRSPAAGNAYFISDDHPVLLWDWIDALLVGLGLPPVRRHISKRAAQAAGVAFELLYYLFRLPGEPRMTRFLAAQLSSDHYFNLARARTDLDYQPDIDNDTGMNRLIQWLDAKAGEKIE